MAKTLFRIIGIKPLMPHLNEIAADDLVKVERIHKALWDHNEWHYLLQGFDINEGEKRIVATKDSVKVLSIFNTENLNVTISAVVGKNGKGKSSLVDLVIRIINNLSAALMGEGYNFAAAEHLHFIDNVFASMAFQIGSTIYVLEERGRNIKLDLYKRTKTSGYEFRYTHSMPIIEGPNVGECRNLPLKKQTQGRRILKSLFYTMVCNYSLYGFNYKEYTEESTPHKRLLSIDEKIGGDEADENHSWLKGIFHKNDGYQTPIVLHPMRKDGKLNVNSENHLANERMAALLFYVDANGNRPFRKINDLDVVAIKLTTTISKRFIRENMLYTLGIAKTRNISKNFDGVYNSILGFWDNKYDILKRSVGRPNRDEACDYIVYKTLKIITSYKKYSPIKSFISKQDFDRAELAEKLMPLYEDFSHVTKKLLQAVNYLLYGIYDPEKKYLNLLELDKVIEPHLQECERKGKKRMLRAAFLPPPIFDTKLVLSHTDHNGIIPFDRLSSGERQFAYTISNFLYHLVNIDSAWNDYYKDKDHAELVKYHFVNVIFDEVELYFHPDMQRKFIASLMSSLNSVRFSENLRGLNIVLATHSPFILSDIPASNILCLGDDKKSIENAFAENIITLLSNGFFMPSTIGEWARLQIDDVVTTYYKMREGKVVFPYYAANRQRFRYLKSIVSDDFLKDMVCRMVDELERNYKLALK